VSGLQPVGQDANLTATGNIGPSGKSIAILGFYVNNTVAGTLVLRKGGAGGTVITGTITPAIGWNPFPVLLPAGGHATIGGTLDVTFIYAEQA
jgi:hypothetical protein